MAVTCALSALPLPDTAALTSLGVCQATGMERRAAASATTPDACAVPITVRTLCWLNIRSIATVSGRSRSIIDSTCTAMVSSRSARSASGGGADDDHLDHPRRQTRAAVDDADAAPGQPRVNAEHPHPAASPADRRPVAGEHMSSG